MFVYFVDMSQIVSSFDTYAAVIPAEFCEDLAIWCQIQPWMLIGIANVYDDEYNDDLNFFYFTKPKILPVLILSLHCAKYWSLVQRLSPSCH